VSPRSDGASGSTSGPGVPEDLRRAFEAYEAAVVADDLPVLAASFAPGGDALRGDGAGVLVGHDAITRFRAGRGGVPPRDVVEVHHRPLGDDAALLVSVSAFRAGGRGLQTQLWERVEGRWVITAAHVTPRPQALDRTVWRCVGDPLVHGAGSGPLAGLSVAVKDLFAVAGFRTGAGNPTHLAGAAVETTSAAAVADLLRGGADLRGIARTDELAYGLAGDNAHYGTPPNGAVPGALPGGSSSGPASAVAAGQAEVGLATDTAGSVRVPASYQGLWGLRTTHGRVDRAGMLPLAPSFDTAGWLTRSGEVLQRVVDHCLPDGGVEVPSRVAVPGALLACADEATRTAFESWLSALSALSPAAGAPCVDRVELPGPSPAECAAAFRTVQGAEAWRAHGAWVTGHPGALGPAVAARLRAAEAVTPEQEAAAREVLAQVRAALEEATSTAVLVWPTAPGPAPGRSHPARTDPALGDQLRASLLAMTTPVSASGLPALSAPLLALDQQTGPDGPDAGPAPVGVCLVGPRGSDAALVALGRRLAGAPTTHPEPHPQTLEGP